MPRNNLLSGKREPRYWRTNEGAEDSMSPKHTARRRRIKNVVHSVVCAINVLAFILTSLPSQTLANTPQAKKPNIVVIFGDDIGTWNISAYHRGMMGGRTPNIDKLAQQGAMFTDYYSQNSCTAGRAAFITGQSPFRTGLLKVGLPGAKQGLQDKDPTIAQLLKAQGYATAQISGSMNLDVVMEALSSGANK